MNKFTLNNSLKNLISSTICLSGLGLLLANTAPAKAQIQVVDPNAGPLSIYDQGGILNTNRNGGFYMQGLEVAPDGSAVYVNQANGMPLNNEGALSTKNKLIRTNGRGRAKQIGPTLASGNHRIWGNELTRGPGGRYYILTNSGIWGFDPNGGLATTFARWPARNIGSSSLTFTPDGKEALSVSDWPGGVFRFLRGGTKFPSRISNTNVPWDDHVITPTGRIIICTEPKFGMQELLPNGNIVKVYDLKADPDVNASLTVAGYGARCAMHPVSKDIFWTLNFETPKPIIVRIKANLSDATVFAKGFPAHIRDIDFGRRSSGASGYSLYVSHNNKETGVGTIYEIPTP